MTGDTIFPPDLEAAIAREAQEIAFEDGDHWWSDAHASCGYECCGGGRDVDRMGLQQDIAVVLQRIARLAWEARGAADGATCAWTLDDAGGDCMWETQCGYAFEFNDGGPADNGAAFCLHCGKRLVESRTSDEPAQEPGA